MGKVKRRLLDLLLPAFGRLLGVSWTPSVPIRRSCCAILAAMLAILAAT